MVTPKELSGIEFHMVIRMTGRGHRLKGDSNTSNSNRDWKSRNNRLVGSADKLKIVILGASDLARFGALISAPTWKMLVSGAA